MNLTIATSEGTSQRVSPNGGQSASSNEGATDGVVFAEVMDEVGSVVVEQEGATAGEVAEVAPQGILALVNEAFYGQGDSHGDAKGASTEEGDALDKSDDEPLFGQAQAGATLTIAAPIVAAQAQQSEPVTTLPEDENAQGAETQYAVQSVLTASQPEEPGVRTSSDTSTKDGTLTLDGPDWQAIDAKTDETPLDTMNKAVFSSTEETASANSIGNESKVMTQATLVAKASAELDTDIAANSASMIIESTALGTSATGSSGAGAESDIEARGAEPEHNGELALPLDAPGETVAEADGIEDNAMEAVPNVSGDDVLAGEKNIAQSGDDASSAASVEHGVVKDLGKSDDNTAKEAKLQEAKSVVEPQQEPSEGNAQDQSFGQEQASDSFEQLHAISSHLKTEGPAISSFDKTLSEPSSRIKDFLTEGVRLSLASNNKEVRLSLSPEHLGTMTIKLSIDDSSVVARVMVGSEAVKLAIENNADALVDLLGKQGLTLEKLSVSVDPQNSQQTMDRDAKNAFYGYSREDGQWGDGHGTGTAGHGHYRRFEDSVEAHRATGAPYDNNERPGGVDLFA